MKFFLKITVVIVIITGGIFMMGNRCSGLGSLKYEKYSSEDPELNITMDYISGWRYSEHRGSYGSYAQVQFYGAVKKDFAPSIVVTVERSSKVTFKPLTIGAMADDLIAKRMKLEDTKIVSRSKIKLLGGPAIDITLTYKKPDKLRSMEVKLIPFKEHLVIFQKDDRFYTLRYMNPEKEFEEFLRAFDHCIKTLRLKE